MVKEVNKNNKSVYQCEECKFLYENKSWAGKCEEWCKKNNSCNLEITRHAVKE